MGALILLIVVIVIARAIFFKPKKRQPYIRPLRTNAKRKRNKKGQWF